MSQFTEIIGMNHHVGKQTSELIVTPVETRQLLLIWGVGGDWPAPTIQIELGVELWNSVNGVWTKLVKSQSQPGAFIHGLMLGGAAQPSQPVGSSGVSIGSSSTPLVQASNQTPVADEFRVYIEINTQDPVNYQVLGLSFS